MARIWEAPDAPGSSNERWALWVQTLCGMELAGNEALGILTPEEWRRRKRELQALGGAPVEDR
jgi:hypothetical protein